MRILMTLLAVLTLVSLATARAGVPREPLPQPEPAMDLPTRPAELPAATEGSIRKAIRELGHPEFALREAAMVRLFWFGDAAKTALKDAKKSGNAEVRARASETLSLIAAFQKLKPFTSETQRAAAICVVSDETDRSAPGGYGIDGGVSHALGEDERKKSDSLQLVVVDKPCVVYDMYIGIALRIVNTTGKPFAITGQDSRIDIIQEAEMKDGTWKAIEYLPGSFCGNSYHQVTLNSGRYWQVSAPRYTGPIDCRIRFRLDLGDSKSIYSEPYDGGIHEAQTTAPERR